MLVLWLRDRSFITHSSELPNQSHTHIHGPEWLFQGMFIPTANPRVNATQAGSAPYLNMAHGEYDGVGQVDFVTVFVDGRRYNGRVDDDRVVCVQRLAAELHAGIFSGQIRTQMLVQDERHPDFPWKTERLLVSLWIYSALLWQSSVVLVQKYLATQQELKKDSHLRESNKLVNH